MQTESLRLAIKLGLWVMVLSWVLMLMAIFAPRSSAAELHLLDPTYLAMEGYDVKNNRDEYLAINDRGSDKYGESSEHWMYGAAVRFNYDLVRYDALALYWNNHVHMAATNVAVRHVGWEFETGLHLGAKVDVFYYHHSQHLMDLERNARHFPLQNLYGVRLILLGKP